MGQHPLGLDGDKLVNWRIEQLEKKLEELHALVWKVLLAVSGSCLLLVANLVLKGKV